MDAMTTSNPAAKVSKNNRFYVVKANDTLCSIAKMFYGDGSKWSTIFQANRFRIGSDPDAVFAGMELVIPA